VNHAIVHVPPHVFQAPRGRYHVRPARPSDRHGLRRMLEAAAPDDIRLRFFRYVRHFPPEFVEPLTRMDEVRHFAFVALRGPSGARAARVAASAMMVADPDGRAAEFAVFVDRRDAGQRLGTHLLHCLIAEARGHGIATLHGLILADNHDMIDLARRLGFALLCELDDPGCVRAELDVAAAAPAARNDLHQCGATPPGIMLDPQGPPGPPQEVQGGQSCN
jgi:acetyltransferase